jgi:CheY-like chemotaxis protein
MKPQSILIVDDNQSNVRLMEAVLECGKYEIKSAADAEEALQLLRDWQPCLILMDIQLPGIDGLELTRRLKQDPKYENVAIVALTAYAMKGDAERALAAGCDGYISKPVDTRTFSGVIEGYLQRAARRPAAGAPGPKNPRKRSGPP